MWEKQNIIMSSLYVNTLLIPNTENKREHNADGIKL
jgi:hypothetical protein